MAKKAVKKATKAKVAKTKTVKFEQKEHGHVQAYVAKAFQKFKVVDLLKRVEPEKKQKIIVQAAKNLADVSDSFTEPEVERLRRARQVSNYLLNPRYAKGIMKKGGIKELVARLSAKPSARRPVAKKASTKARSKVAKQKAPTAAPAEETSQAAA